MKKIKRTPNFRKDYRRLPKHIKDSFWKKLELLFADPRHPSLDLKKMQGHANLWRCKLTAGYRFTFEIIHGDTYLFRRVGPHDIERKP